MRPRLPKEKRPRGAPNHLESASSHRRPPTKGFSSWLLQSHPDRILQLPEHLPATTAEIRARVGAGTPLEPQITDATAATLLARFTTRPIPEICAMGGITLEDFTQSVAYREIFGLGEEQGRDEGLQQGRQAGELKITLRLLRRRCGALTPEQETQLRALPLPRLEALAEALLDFQGPDDLNAWLAEG